MENSKGSPRVKTKCSNLTRLLLPMKIPNKIGVTNGTDASDNENVHSKNAAIRSTPSKSAAVNVFRRPLSLNSSNLRTLSNDNLLKVNGRDVELRRCSSVCEADLQADVLLAKKSANTSHSHHDLPLQDGTTADNLARRALLAAQLLHLIPAQKARQRNFLHGRVGANSLLGPAELDKSFPVREVTIFVGTWNMNGHAPPAELNDFVLPTGLEHVPDILVFGTQESCSERFEWEVCLQETLGPTHVLFHSTSLGTLHLVIFLRRDLIWYCSVAEDASLSVRPGTAFKTKGAVASAFTLFGSSFLFVTAHLTAHQEKVKERVADVRKIVNALDLPRNLPCKSKSKDATQNFDYVFWCGDLNFRLATPRDKVLEWLSKTNFPLPPHMPHGYLHHDQLCSVLADGAAFKGFYEANITFPPTYKYDVGTQNFDTSAKQRTPGYTDRILYKQRTVRRLSHVEAPQLECIIYDSVPSITTSDHKPVWGVFKAHLRPGIDTIPLAAGLFNREVYMEGIRRRATSFDDQRNESTVCSIQ